MRTLVGLSRKQELKRAVQRSLREFDAEFDILEQVVATHLGISRTDGRALEIIERRCGSTPGELARDLGFTRSAVTVVLNRLEAAGLAERSLSNSDRRRLAIHVTPAGEALIRGWFSDLGRRVDRVLRDMSEEDLDAVSRFMQDVTAIAAEARSHIKAISEV